MANWHAIDVDLAKVYGSKDRKNFLRTLIWGDPVDVVEVTEKHVEVGITKYVEAEDGSIIPERVSGFIVPGASSGVRPVDVVRKKSNVLKVHFVDVQQGDGTLIETPRGEVILVDGGDNQLFARFLAGRFRGTRRDRPKSVDCIVVTHGDADHFQGLTNIQESERYAGKGPQSEWAWKRLFIQPRRVYHNGLVKRPASENGKRRSDAKLLGPTVTRGKETFLVGLEDDLLAVPDAEMNEPFLAWKRALAEYEARATARGEDPILFRRLEKGDDDAFDFVAPDVKIEVLGPLTNTVDGKPALPFLGNPPEDIGVGHAAMNPENKRFRGKSAAHTINGHSIILRLTYGNVRFLFAGDLNEQSEIELTRAHEAGELDLAAEVFKVPHHGSADYSAPFLEAVAPVVSVVSSGDESARKEYIHPRATLMSALGRYSRPEVNPVVLVTELVAFFKVEGYVQPERHLFENGIAVVRDGKALENPKASRSFFAFSRTAFGLVRARTDGKRLLVSTDSGQVSLKEAYAYEVGERGEVRPTRVRQV